MIFNRYLKWAVFMEEQSFLSEHAASLSSWINSPTFLNSGRDKSWLRAWSIVIESGIDNIFLQFVFSYWIRNCKKMTFLFFVNMIIRILLYINIDIKQSLNTFTGKNVLCGWSTNLFLWKCETNSLTVVLFAVLFYFY